MSIQTILTEELQALRERIAANMDAAGASASGRTVRSLRVEATEETGKLWGRDAFGVLETGRRPGKVPKGFYQTIRRWAEDKGITFPSQRNKNRFSYFVARKIANEGTRLYRNGGRNDIYSNEIPQTLRSIKTRILNEYISEFDIETIRINL